MRVEVSHLKKHFGATRAVDDISFSFGSGDVFGFVGPNGAGKTTTMPILATIDDPTSGSVRLDGISVVEEPEKARRFVGYVPDALPAHRDITVHEYLDFFARAYGLPRETRLRVVEETERFTNLIGIREKTVSALSKGMKQRVSMARALLHDPPVLVLDEPAAGLDPRARIELRELLRVLAAQGKAILISSHILTELAEICTGAVIIERGKILRAGSLAEIVSTGTPRRTVVLRSANGGPAAGDASAAAVQRLCADVQLQPGVVTARAVGADVEAVVEGDDAALADLLARLVAAGHRIVEFRLQRANLEDVFMSVTKGEVQ